MIVNTVAVVRMADKIRRRMIVPHPDWRFLPGLVNFAYIISAMIMIHPEANPSPRLENTNQNDLKESYQLKCY